jgi:biopolymer transport protein ExbB/TolQ
MNAPGSSTPPLPSDLARVSGVTQWLFWFAVITVGVVVMAVLYARLGAPKQWWLDYMTVAITLLFVCTVIKSFFDVSFLARQTKLARIQVQELARYNDLNAFLKATAHSPSIFRSHIASLHHILMSAPDVSQDALIEITHARLVARNKVVELLASILITLGLIGTIIGLLLAVGGLGQLIGGNSTDMDQLMEGMQTTIGGLGTAFYTTLFGAAFGGVTLRILTSVVEANILRYIAHLSELSEVFVLPAMRRAAAKLQRVGYYEKLDEAR